MQMKLPGLSTISPYMCQRHGYTPNMHGCVATAASSCVHACGCGRFGREGGL